MHPTGPFSIPAIRNFVPEKLKPWVIILFVIVFQFSGGVYLAAVSEMVGSTALMQEDIMMAGYASMVGMALTFAIMFRLKFRFTSKVALLTCCTALIICNLISMYTRNVPVLIFACFIAGFFRMWGTFECNSTIQLFHLFSGTGKYPTVGTGHDLCHLFCQMGIYALAAHRVTGECDVADRRIVPHLPYPE